MMVSMELRNPMTCLHHWSEGPWCPLNAQAADRWLEPSGEPLPFFAVAEDWLRLAELTGTPRFFHINLQYFFAGRCYAHNRRALEWLAEQRDRGRLDIGGIRPWAERMRAGGGFLRQTTYWRGEMMGFHVGHRPGSVADVIVDESLQGQIIWESPSPVPQRWYDYAPRWNYPAFEPHGTAPASQSVAGIEVAAILAGEAGVERHLEVVIRNAAAARSVPLALWSLLEDCRGPFTVESPGWQAEVVPHPAGVGGTVLLAGRWPAGETRVTVRVRHGGTAANRHKRTWGDLLAAQTFEFRHRPYTVLVTQAPERFAVTVRVRRTQPGAEPVRVESLCGIDYEARTMPANGLPLQFDGTRLACWHRFWDVTADELDVEGVEEVEARLRQQTAALVAAVAPRVAVPAPGYQRFGNITDRSRWDRAVGCAAGEAERLRMEEWFRKLCPAAGETVIAAHPGLYLPRGSITKVLGHEFDVVHCAAGPRELPATRLR